MNDEHYMQMALKLAEQGCGRVNPNPMVGAVIVKNGAVIGQGFHAACGKLHAERAALADCKEPPDGAELYVTLEPCCHHGQQPPCTDAILESGIRRVVIGSADPNPLVAGKGVSRLRSHGIEVTEGILRPQCDRLNRVFFHFIRTGLPYVIMKYAMTMDGKIAACTGASKWITGSQARQRVQEDRNRYPAIMTGVGTVLADDPLLTCRLPGSRSPIRIICDTHLRTPLSARIVTTVSAAPTLLVTCCTDSARHQPYVDAGCNVLVVPKRDGHLDLHVLMKLLGARGIDGILLEGGGRLNWSALQSGIVSMVQTYIAPKLFGGELSLSPIEGAGVRLPDDAFRLSIPTVTCLGRDLLLESEVL